MCEVYQVDGIIGKLERIIRSLLNTQCALFSDIKVFLKVHFNVKTHAAFKSVGSQTQNVSIKNDLETVKIIYFIYQKKVDHFRNRTIKL